jgi:hypothetical protein
MTYHRVCIKSNTSGTTSGVWSAKPSGAPVLCMVDVARSLVFCVVFCRSLFVLFLLAIVLCVLLLLTASDYPFGIFKLFFLSA